MLLPSQMATSCKNLNRVATVLPDLTAPWAILNLALELCMNSTCLSENGGGDNDHLQSWDVLSKSLTQLIADTDKLPPEEMIKPISHYDLLMVFYLLQRICYLNSLNKPKS